MISSRTVASCSVLSLRAAYKKSGTSPNEVDTSLVKSQLLHFHRKEKHYTLIKRQEQLIKGKVNLKCSFDKSWNVQIRAKKNNKWLVMNSQGKTGAGN